MPSSSPELVLSPHINTADHQDTAKPNTTMTSELSHGGASMASFMSGLLAERAVQLELPKSNWSINIVDDNARPKQVDKRKMRMTRQRQTQSCRDFRWGGGDIIEDKPTNPLLSRAGRCAPIQETASPLLAGVVKKTIGNSVITDFRKTTDSNSRFSSDIKDKGLLRVAASDTMLLKMPVRSRSPRVVRKTLGSAMQANAKWGNPQQDASSSRLANLPKIPKFDFGNVDATDRTTPLEDDWSCRSSNASSVSLASSSQRSRSINGLSRSSYSSLSMGSSKFSGSDLGKKYKKKKKANTSSHSMSSSNTSLRSGDSSLGGGSSRKSSSSDSFKKRASLLGLDLK